MRDRSVVLLLLVSSWLSASSLCAEPPAAGASPPAASSAEVSSADVSSAEAEMAALMAFQKAFQVAHRDVSDANPLRQIERFEALAAEYSAVPDAGDLLASVLAWKWSVAGDARAAHRAFDVGTPVEAPDVSTTDAARASLRGFEAVDAVSAILEAVGDRRAVFINEAHHVARHRLLTLRLLPALRAAGFTHFAAETVTEDPGSLQDRGYVASSTGVYTDEPLYADLVRTALRLGFVIVPYESPGRPAQREPGQARRLVDGVFEQQPDARVVVHLGYSHNQETADAFGGVGAMAHHFRELTGIDPLTIDQTVLSERGRVELEHSLYQQLCADAEADDAVAFRNREGGLWSLPGDGRDVTVCLPRSRYVSGRATWWRLGGLRRSVELPEGLCEDTNPCLVEARWIGDGDDAIPIDRAVIRQGDAPPVLMLPDGRFRIEARSIEDRRLGGIERRVGSSPSDTP